MATDFISPEALCEALRSGQTEVITIDVRPYSDYVVGHISGAFSVRLSSILIRRLATGKIPFIDIIADAQKERFRQWSSTGCKRYVVYDDGPADASSSGDSKSPLNVVAKSLVRDDRVILNLQDDEPLSRVGANACACVSGPAMDGEHSPVVDKTVRDNHPSEILSYLYVGSQQHAQNKAILDGIRVTHILNITATCPNWFPTSISYKTIQIKLKRSIVAPNLDFLSELETYERTLRGLGPIPQMTSPEPEPESSEPSSTTGAPCSVAETSSHSNSVSESSLPPDMGEDEAPMVLSAATPRASLLAEDAQPMQSVGESVADVEPTLYHAAHAAHAAHIRSSPRESPGIPLRSPLAGPASCVSPSPLQSNIFAL